MFALKDSALDKNSSKEQSVFLILKLPIKMLNNKMIFKYYPITTDWEWGYWRSRYQLKSVIYIMRKSHVFIKGYDLRDHNNFNAFLNGELLFEDLIGRGSYTWYPEDYTYAQNETTQAKDTDELDKIFSYIREAKYLEYNNENFSNRRGS
jgi:hypothetical protein